MAEAEASAILGRITDTAVHMVDSNISLVNRLAKQSSTGPAQDRRGALQDVWMTLAEEAGDLVQISYLSAQFLDALFGLNRRPGDGGENTG